MFELKQMEAIDSDEFKENPFFCLSAREQCTRQLNLNRVIVCCYLSWLIKILFSLWKLLFQLKQLHY